MSQAQAPPVSPGRPRIRPLSPRVVDRRWPATGGALLVATGLALAGLVIAVSSSFFYADDYLNMGLARQEGLGLTLLKWSVYGELAPGHRLLDWLMGVHLGLHWAWAMAIMFAFWALAVVAFAWLLSELVEHRWLVVVGTALFASAPAFVRIMQWWANAEHEMPWIALTFVCVLASLRWMLRREARWLVLAAAIYLVSILFYAETVLTPLLVVALAYFVPSRVQRPLSMRRLRTDLPLLALFVLVTLAYLAASKAGGYLSIPKAAGLTTWVAYYRTDWLQGVTPWVVGQSTVPNTGGVGPVVVVAAQVALLALVVASLVRSRAAWRAWAFYVVIWAVGAFIVGNDRLGMYGPTMAYDPRYNAAMIFVLPLCIVLAFAASPVRTQVEGRRIRWMERVGRVGRVGRAGRAGPAGLISIAGAALAIALAVSIGTSYARISNAWPAGAAGAWASHVRSSIAALRRQGIQPSVLDGDVPPTAEPENQEQFTLLSVVLPMFMDGIVVDDQTGRDPPAVAAPDGTVELAAPQVITSWSAAQLLRDHVVAPPSPVAVHLRGGALCAAAGTVPLLLPFSTSAPTSSAADVLELTLPPGRSSGVLFLYLDTGGGYPFGPTKVLTVALQDRVLRVSLPGRLARVRIDLEPGTRACISAVRIVRYTAR